jgi:hypothetical protein
MISQLGGKLLALACPYDMSISYLKKSYLTNLIDLLSSEVSTSERFENIIVQH